jgi:DNA gyrase subunit A
MREPSVLPAEFPNLLVNGADGIAVGMATKIPPHNLGEVIDACLAYLARPDITVEELLEHVIGPDFPTGGLILGQSGIRAAYHTGRGSIVMRARTEVETIRKDREAIIVTEIPFQVNKAKMIERIAELVREKRVEGIAELRDESDRDGVRVVIELKRDAQADIVLNQLYRYSQLQTSFGVNMLALNNARPELMKLNEVIAAFIAFRETVITRRTRFELARARERAHVLAGLAVAVANIDAMIALIRKSRDPAEARAALTGQDWPARDVRPLIELIGDPRQSVTPHGTCRLTDEQARAILDLRLQRLTALERDKIADELKGIVEQIKEHIRILQDPVRLREVLATELKAIRAQFATPRRTEIVEIEFEADIEDLIQREDMVVTVSHAGYVKRVPLSAYRAQRRGGKGRAGMSTREEDFVSQVFVLNTHTPVLFFSTAGKVYKLKVYRLPSAAPQARGKALVNLLPLSPGETVSTLLPMPEDETKWGGLQMMFATSSGYVRRNSAADFANVPSNGKIAMKLDEGDRIVGVQICTKDDDVLLAAGGGLCVRFPVGDVREFKGRSSQGVRGMELASGDKVISMTILKHTDIEIEERDAYLRWSSTRRRGEPTETPRDAAAFEMMGQDEQFVLTITSDGFGKRTSAYEYRITRRGGKGLINIDTSRGAKVVAAFPIAQSDQIMLVTDNGQLIRCPVDDIRIAGRNTRGVRVFRLPSDARVVSVARLAEEAENGAAEIAQGGADGGGMA